MQAQLGPWIPSRQCVIMYSVCIACFLHSGYSVDSLSTVKLSHIKERDKKSKYYLSFQSPSRLNRLPPVAHNDNTQCPVWSCSWNTYPCTITADHGEGWHESQWHDDRNIEAVSLPNFGTPFITSCKALEESGVDAECRNRWDPC